MSAALHDLAQEAGLLVEWEDAHGAMQTVSDETLRTVLDALGMPGETPAQIAETRAWLRAEQARAARSFLTADAGAPISIPVEPGAARLRLESGEVREMRIERGGRLALIDEPGYHRLETSGGETVIAVSPGRGFGVGDAGGKPRIWGAAAQVPSLRSEPPSPFGTFREVGDFARLLGERGAQALAISPVHALFPADPSRFSPYAPSTRLFLNILFCDAAVIGEQFDAAGGSDDLIDWQSAIPERLAQLRALFQRCGKDHAGAVDAFAKAGGADLVRHARFDALYAHFFAKDGSHGWQAWPERFHDPEAAATQDFARENDEEVRFFLFAQWLADRSLERAHAEARAGGMSVGLVSDLAVGMDAGGSHAWSRPQDILTGLSVGAPPDLLGPQGQNWGLTTFSPLALQRGGFDAFLATIRAALRHAGGVRIDHVLGLRRIWVVPEGASPRDGVYLSYPQRDLFRLLALESVRADALVVGEDLGTVPAGLRDEMDASGLLGMRVLWFERDEDGVFTPPAAWDRGAAAMTSTHDLPTVAGWWSGRDIDWTWEIGRKSPFKDEKTERATREADRVALWNALDGEGVIPAADAPEKAVDAALEFVGSTRCDMAIIPAEDLFGLVEQPNLPGTIEEHPNWRRRLPASAERLLDDPVIAARLQRLGKAREG